MTGVFQRGVFALATLLALVASQWVRTLPAAPHAPLDECALHQCGCEPDKTKRQTCCCYPDAPTKADSKSLAFRASTCAGDAPAPEAAPLAPLQFVLPSHSAISNSDCCVRTAGDRPPAWRSVSLRPPVPPPEFREIG